MEHSRELGEVSDLIARPCACRLIHESVTVRDEHLADIGPRDSGTTRSNALGHDRFERNRNEDQGELSVLTSGEL